MDIEVIKVPAPKEVGDVNCILIDAEKPAIIDPGPATQEAFEAVRNGLSQNGIEIENLEWIFITHPHSDHFGNAGRIKQESGARIAMHREAARIVENFESYKDRQIEFFSDYLQRMGVKKDGIRDILDKGLPNTYDTNLEVDRELEDGETVDIGSQVLKCVRVEGHARGSMCYELLEENIVFTGDFILPDITPNPMLMLPEEVSRPPSSLELYLSSLNSFDGEGMRGYGGHEGLIEDIDERISEIKEHHNRRKTAMLDEISGEMSAFELMEEFFGELPENQYFLGMAETISHLRLLESEGKVKRVEKEGTVFFRET